MYRWSVTFLVIAVVAGIFGFGGLANDSAYIAKIAFVIALIITIGSFLVGRRVNT